MGLGQRTLESEWQIDLRLRALSRLTAGDGPEKARAGASAALAVLHQLASSPATAADALALLHEMQILQVELDLQTEELTNSRAELEADLIRQIQLYDFAPVSCFTVERSTKMRELNLTAAHLLGSDRDSLLGQTLDSFLVPRSGDALHKLLGRVSEGHLAEVCALKLMPREGPPQLVYASASTDPAGQLFMVAFLDTGENTT